MGGSKLLLLFASLLSLLLLVTSCNTNCCQTTVQLNCCVCVPSAKKCCKTSITTEPTVPIEPTPVATIIISKINQTESQPSVSKSSLNTSSKTDNEVNSQINLDNRIQNTNRINIPVEVTNTNINNIYFARSSSVKQPDINISVSVPPFYPSIPTVTYPTVTYPTVTYPTYTYPPYTTTTTTWRTTTTTRSPTTTPGRTTTVNCCLVQQPCFHASDCLYPRTICSPQCVTPIIYVAYNPCQSYGGCVRRDSWQRRTCYSDHSCSNYQQDCSQCDFNYYMSYHSYQQCHGCFHHM